MDINTLQHTHEVYNEHIKDWAFFGLAYQGGTPFIDYSLQRHPRESQANWKARQAEGVCFNYSSIVIDLFNFYLTEKPAVRQLSKLAEDPLWEMFIKDADLYGTNFDVFLNEAQKMAGIYGAVGVLIDKASSDNKTLKDDMQSKIYPYCALFTLPNILDWEHERDPITNRPTLTYLKLLDFDNRYLLWWPDRWEIWKLPEGNLSPMRIHKHKDTTNYKLKPGDNKWVDEPGQPYKTQIGQDEPILISAGENPLGEIPFVWFQNIKSVVNPYIGVSDIKEISRITASVIRNISYGEEVIKFAGFPQARRPMEREGQETNNEAGPTAILEFDPELGEAGKPDWLESKVQEPVDAILSWIGKKISEIFQLAHLSGIHAHEKSDQVRSGVALRYEYQQLSLVLTKKSENVTETELGIIKYWLKWQQKSEWFNSMLISRSKDFSIDDLSQNLENAIMANKIVPELTFKKELMKVVAKRVLPDIADVKLTEIYAKIEELTEEDLIEKEDGITENRSTKDIRQDIQEKWKRDNDNSMSAVTVASPYDSTK
jgi:hypothetical protein